MQKILLTLLCFLLISSVCSAEEENFYLITRTAPQKLIPNTLSLTIQKGESQTVTVDPIPKDADVSEIAWELAGDSGIASIAWDGQTCTIRALSEGSGVLTARDPNGASCEIKLSVLNTLSRSLKLRASADTIQAGDTALVHAVAEPANAEILWQVESNGTSSVSYGGAVCKINAQAEGNVHIRASIAGSDISSDYTLYIEPAPESYYPVFDTMASLLLYGGIALLLLSLILFVKGGGSPAKRTL